MNALVRAIDRLRFAIPLYANKQKKALDYATEISDLSQKSTENMEAYISQKKRDLLSYAFENVQWYKDLSKKLPSIESLATDPRLWREIPTVDRDVIGPDESKFISRLHKANNWNDTSGSTGRKFRFLRDHNQTLWAEASTAFVRKQILGLYAPREIIIWGAPRDKQPNEKFLSKLKLLVRQRKTVIAYQMNPEKSLDILKEVSEFKPEILTGYPNILKYLSEYDKDGVLSRAKAIITAGEWFRPNLRKKLEEHTQKQIFDFYGCREIGSIAYECKAHNGLHILSPLVYVECLRKDQTPCEPGEMGELVVTSLVRRSMPLIRYRIGDMGILSDEKCSCGCPFPLIKEICGRTMDVVTLPDGRTIAGYFWTHFARKMNGINQFRLVQDETGQITLEIVPEAGAPANLQKTILAEAKKRTGIQDGLSVKLVEGLPVNQSGKSGLVVSHYKG